MPGILDRSISETPLTVVDFETTGIHPKRDRVVEVTVVRKDPGEEPTVIFDSLINPERRVGATDVHGITDEDVKGAPVFGEIAGDLIQAIQGSVVSAYNVYFDIKFLMAELERLGIDAVPPHFCLMYMRPMLGIGKKCKLDEACKQHGVPLKNAHTAYDDAMASAVLFDTYRDAIESHGVETYGDLARLANYKFVNSFEYEPLPRPEEFNLPPSGKAFSRKGHVASAVLSDEQIAIRAYWDVIKMVVADLQVTDEEATLAIEERKKLGLSKEQIRFLHARAFSSAISQFIDDQHLDDDEVRKLRKLHKALSRLGWAPGE